MIIEVKIGSVEIRIEKEVSCVNAGSTSEKESIKETIALLKEVVVSAKELYHTK